MPTRHERYSPVWEYQPNVVSAKTTVTDGAALGALLDTTTTTTISAGSQQITLAAISSDIQVGRSLVIWDSTNDEIVTVTAVDYANKKITATFANSHSGTTHVTTRTGTKLGTIMISNAGSAVVLALWNGVPGMASSTPASVNFASFTTTVGPLYFNCTVDQGLWYTYTGTTAGNLTIMTLTDPV